MGGDEFAILISDMEDANEAIKVAEKLLSVIEGP
jgi:GGDEF domain-containing protein